MKDLVNVVRILFYGLLILLLFEATGKSPISLAEKNWQELTSKFPQFNQQSESLPLPAEPLP